MVLDRIFKYDKGLTEEAFKYVSMLLMPTEAFLNIYHTHLAMARKYDNLQVCVGIVKSPYKSFAEKRMFLLLNGDVIDFNAILFDEGEESEYYIATSYSMDEYTEIVRDKLYDYSLREETANSVDRLISRLRSTSLIHVRK